MIEKFYPYDYFVPSWSRMVAKANGWSFVFVDMCAAGVDCRVSLLSTMERAATCIFFTTCLFTNTESWSHYYQRFFNTILMVFDITRQEYEKWLSGLHVAR